MLRFVSTCFILLALAWVVGGESARGVLRAGAIKIEAQNAPAPVERTRVKRVLNAGAIRLLDGRIVSLAHIESPSERSECGARRATIALRKILQPGTPVELALSQQEGEVYMYTAGQNVAVALVERGGGIVDANAESRPPGQMAMQDAERRAREQAKGLWLLCQAEHANGHVHFKPLA